MIAAAYLLTLVVCTLGINTTTLWYTFFRSKKTLWVYMGGRIMSQGLVLLLNAALTFVLVPFCDKYLKNSAYDSFLSFRLFRQPDKGCRFSFRKNCLGVNDAERPQRNRISKAGNERRNDDHHGNRRAKQKQVFQKVAQKRGRRGRKYGGNRFLKLSSKPSFFRRTEKFRNVVVPKHNSMPQSMA